MRDFLNKAIEKSKRYYLPIGLACLGGIILKTGYRDTVLAHPPDSVVEYRKTSDELFKLRGVQEFTKNEKTGSDYMIEAKKALKFEPSKGLERAISRAEAHLEELKKDPEFVVYSCFEDKRGTLDWIDTLLFVGAINFGIYGFGELVFRTPRKTNAVQRETPVTN